MKFNFNDAQPILLFEVLIVQCQNRIKYILLRSLSAAMFTWPCKTNFTTVPDPLELQILLEDQTATEILFQSYAATTTIDRMTWLACISHYVRGHVHKTGHNYNSTTLADFQFIPRSQGLSTELHACTLEERWAKVLGASWEVVCARRSGSGASGEGSGSERQSLTHPLAMFSCSHLIAPSP